MPHENEPDQVAPAVPATLVSIRWPLTDCADREARRLFFVEGVRGVVLADAVYRFRPG